MKLRVNDILSLLCSAPRSRVRNVYEFPVLRDERSSNYVNIKARDKKLVLRSNQKEVGAFRDGRGQKCLNIGV